MAVRTPLVYDVTGNLRQATSAELVTARQAAALEWLLSPSFYLYADYFDGTSIGNLAERYYLPGAYRHSNSGYFSEADTAEPVEDNNTWALLRSQTDSVSQPADTNARRFPVYYDGSNLRSMSYTDFRDTFILPALLNYLTIFPEPYTVSTSADLSAQGYTPFSDVDFGSHTIFEDYWAWESGTLAQKPIMSGALNVTRYYAFYYSNYSRSLVSNPPEFFVLDSSGNVQLKDCRDDYRAAIRYEGITTANYRVRYNCASITSSLYDVYFGTLGTTIQDHILSEGATGTQRRYQTGDNYYSQEYPSGTKTLLRAYNLTWGLT